MNHEEAFLAEILAHPDDDGPRLIFADYLSEKGQEARSVFIRLQCELALWGSDARPRAYGNWYVDCRNRKDYPGVEDECHAPPINGKSECEYHALRRRERELLGAHALAWSDPIMETGLTPGCFNAGDGWFAYGDARWTFHRGFVEALTCTAAAWLEHADALTAAAPIREVRLTTWLDFYDENRVPVLHDGRHPNIGSTTRRCLLAKLPAYFDGRFSHANVSGLLAAEWPRITFHLPPPRIELERDDGGRIIGMDFSPR